LRSALASAASGQAIEFDGTLNGGTIALSIVADEHTVLKGEVMGMRDEPSGPVSYLVGYFDRDYGRSALVARKDVVIDASKLQSGITIAWAGTTPAPVLAVSGDLTLVNVTITGGHSVTENISASNPNQPWTLARGGAVAVWGVARLSDCRLHDNHVEGDFESSRDRGAFGGAVYADIVQMPALRRERQLRPRRRRGRRRGVFGGRRGRFPVGLEHRPFHDQRQRDPGTVRLWCRGLFGRRWHRQQQDAARHQHDDRAQPRGAVARIAAVPVAMGYWRGGGLYLSNGYLELQGATIVENRVRGVRAPTVSAGATSPAASPRRWATPTPSSG